MSGQHIDYGIGIGSRSNGFLHMSDYSAIVLYFGAEFTKVYALAFGNKIIPNNYTVYIDKEEREIEPHVVNPQK